MPVKFGDVREDLARHLGDILGYIVSRKMDLDVPYYILVHANVLDTNIIFTKVVTMLRRPIPMLGTICFKIDNRLGAWEKMWVLPLDVDLSEYIPGSTFQDNQVQEIAQAAGVLASRRII